MKRRTKSKTVAAVLYFLSFIVMLGVPLCVIVDTFPVRKDGGGILSTLGVGAVIMSIIAFLVFKKYILAYAAEKLGVISAGVSLIFTFGGVSAVLVILANSATLLNDLVTVFVTATVGVSVGVLMQFVAKSIKERSSHEETE